MLLTKIKLNLTGTQTAKTNIHNKNFISRVSSKENAMPHVGSGGNTDF